MGADSEMGKKLEQSPAYDDAQDMLHRLEGLRFPHTQILELMNWKIKAFQAGVESVKAELIAKIEEKRVLFCQGCLRKKPLVRPASSSSIVGGAGIHTPEGWVCVTDLILETLGVDVASLSLQGRKQEK